MNWLLGSLASPPSPMEPGRPGMGGAASLLTQTPGRGRPLVKKKSLMSPSKEMVFVKKPGKVSAWDLKVDSRSAVERKPRRTTDMAPPRTALFIRHVI